MSLTAQEIMQVMEKARELGLTSFKAEGIEFTSQPTPQAQVVIQEMKRPVEVPEMEAKDIVVPMSVLDDLDEDEVKYWATPYYDELQEKKDLQRQMVKDHEVK